MRVTIDIPEGYEAKIVKVENDTPILEFQMDTNDAFAELVLKTARENITQWNYMKMHKCACGNPDKTLYTILAWN